MKLRVLRLVVDVLFILCIPVLLVTSNGRGAISTPRLHEYGYDKYEAVTSTGMEKAELLDIAEGLIYYFNSGQELAVAEYFYQHEVMHLADVKNLIGLFYWVQEACLMYVIFYIFIGYFLLKRKWWPRLARRLIWGCGLTLGSLAAVGIAFAINFDGLFTWFHQVSFDNYFWLMPHSYLLPKLYPEAFFFEASLYVVIATVIECMFIGGISAGYLIYRRRKSVATITTGG